MLEKEYKYFLENKDSLLKEYRNMFIVIKDDKVVGSYTTQDEALSESSRKYALGTFLIQKISDKPEDVSQRFFSAMVCFQ